MARPVEIVNFQELPMHVTDMPIELGASAQDAASVARALSVRKLRKNQYAINTLLNNYTGHRGGNHDARLLRLAKYGWYKTPAGWTMRGDPVIGWGFFKKAWKGLKKVAKKVARPLKRVARTITWPARKVWKHAVPRSVKRFVRRTSSAAWRATKWAGRTAWKYGKKLAKVALFPIVAAFQLLAKFGMMIIRKYFGGAMKKMTRRRARYLAYQRRRSNQPTRAETVEAARWTRRYAKSQGLFTKLTGAVRNNAKKMAKSPRVRAKLSMNVSRRSRMSGEENEKGGESGGISVALVMQMIPLIISLIKSFMNRGAQQGAPADPRQAAPEANLQAEISAGYTRPAMQNMGQPGGAESMIRHFAPQFSSTPPEPKSFGEMAANAAMSFFRPPASNQPAMTYNYPEPEPQQFDFPTPPAFPALPTFRMPTLPPMPQFNLPRVPRFRMPRADVDFQASARIDPGGFVDF